MVWMTLLKTQLYNWHKNKAKMVPFAGFEMPVVYNSPSSITNEHLIVRNSAGLFDVSHMGRMIIEGKDAPFQVSGKDDLHSSVHSLLIDTVHAANDIFIL